jgi:hypothetical protein
VMTQLSAPMMIVSLATVVAWGAPGSSQTLPRSMGLLASTSTSLQADFTEQERKERCAHLKTLISALGQEKERRFKQMEIARYERMQREINCPSDDVMAGTWELAGKNDRFTRGLSAILTLQRMDPLEGSKQAESHNVGKCVIRYHERFYSGTIDWRGSQPSRDTVLLCADPPGPGSMLLIGTGRFRESDDQSGSINFLMFDIDKMAVTVMPERSGRPTNLNFDAKRTQK